MAGRPGLADKLNSKKGTYLLVGKPELVLQDSVPVRQALDFIGESVERVNERVRVRDVAHHIVGASV
jgi:hypothetical protein